MSNIRIQGPLQFPGYTQTNAGGVNTQVLTYTDGDAEWQSLPGVTADQLVCFFTYFLNGIEVKVPAIIYAESGAIPANDEVYDSMTNTTTLTPKNVTIVNGALPCRVFNNNVYTNDNIALRT